MSMKSSNKVNHSIHQVSKISLLSKICGFYTQQFVTSKEAFRFYL